MHDDEARAQAALGWPALEQLAQIDDRHRRPPIDEDAGDLLWGPGDRIDGHEREHFRNLTGVDRIAMRAHLKDQKEHYAATLNRDTLLFMPAAARFNPSMTWLDWRSDSTVCWAASLSCPSDSVICSAPVACACIPSLTASNRGARAWTW